MDSIPHDGGCSPIDVLSIWLEFEGISALLLSDFAKPLARFHGVASQLKTLRISMVVPIQPPFLWPRTGALPFLQMMHARP